MEIFFFWLKENIEDSLFLICERGFLLCDGYGKIWKFVIGES